MLYDIISPDNIDVIASDNEKYSIAGAQSIKFAASFGEILFQHFPGNGFDIWCADYQINQPTNIILKASSITYWFSLCMRGAYEDLS